MATLPLELGTRFHPFCYKATNRTTPVRDLRPPSR